MTEQELQEIKKRMTEFEWDPSNDGVYYKFTRDFMAFGRENIPALIQAVEERDRRIENGLAALVCLHAFLEQIPQAVRLAAMIKIWFSEFTHPDEETAQKFLQDLTARNAKERLETLGAAPTPPPSQPSDLTQTDNDEAK